MAAESFERSCPHCAMGFSQSLEFRALRGVYFRAVGIWSRLAAL